MNPEPVKSPPGRSLLKVLIRVALALVVGLAISALSAELLFRHLLFGASPLAKRYGPSLRKPHYYADYQSDDDFFKLQRTLVFQGQREQFVHRDERLGWLTPLVEPGTYAHKAEAWLRGRRPVLMYGDSFTACMTPPTECWQGLLGNDPERGRRMLLLNYGTWSFGMDQAYLLFRDSIERWKEQEPIVAFGVLVDDDVDRVVLGFRGCPKPLTRLVDGRLQFEYPGTPDIEEWMRRNPPRRGSYFLRFLALHNATARRLASKLDPAPAVLLERKSRLGRALVKAVKEVADAHAAEMFFVLFHEPRSSEKLEPFGWRERVLVKALEDFGIPYVSSKHALHEHARLHGHQLSEYFITQGNAAGHLNELGNQAVFAGLLRALDGVFDWAPGMPSRL